MGAQCEDSVLRQAINYPAVSPGIRDRGCIHGNFAGAAVLLAAISFAALRHSNNKLTYARKRIVMSFHAAPERNCPKSKRSHVLENLAGRFSIGIQFVMLLAFAPGASAQEREDIKAGDTAYYCKLRGNEQWSYKPCEELGGTELRKGVFVDPAEPKHPMPDKFPEQASGPESARAQEAASAMQAAEQQVAEKKLTESKQSLKSMLRWMFFALAFGVVAKLTGRSFIRWFVVGSAANFLLVALNVFPV
jgi:hypothetical protein